MILGSRRGRGASLSVACLLVVLAWLAGGGLDHPEAAAGPPALQGAGRISHALTVSLDPARHALAVTDVVRLPEHPAGGTVEFLLNGALVITRSEPPAREVPLADTTRFFGLNAGPGEHRPPVKRYQVSLPEGRAVLSLTYEGTMDFALSPEKEQYTRGFRQTAGTIGPEGAYLAGSGFWYPAFGPDLVEFTLDVRQPEGWHVVAQGNGTSRDADGRARWDSGGPTDEIYLVGGPLQVFHDRAGGVETLVYLHERDQGLASKYLEATGQYLEMYRQVIGPYPYGKFALVENFWETGYGMPSFTLLGPEVIRFPFILTSSYPNEILHNWWGNSVFVDFQSGNWSEGLTAYLADHLVQEQRGAGAEYRRATLQKYRDYVRDGRDFPLTEFRARESASTEAVGYGKALMAFHMARLAVGDDAFRKALAAFYRDFQGKRASFDDFRRSLESASGRDFTRFFRDWIERAGAPALAVADVQWTRAAVPATTAARDKGAWRVSGTLRQTQGGEPFTVDVPLVIQTARGVERHKVRMEGAEQRFDLDAHDEPLMLHVDPDFDLFRKLDPRETPPSVGQIFGEPRALAIVPARAPEAERRAWRALFEGWRSASHAIEIRSDDEVTSLPADRAVWVAGRHNTFADAVLSAGGAATVRDAIGLDGQQVPLAAHTVVVVARHPRTVDKAIGFLHVDPPAAFAGLGRKLPHYGKYSYLAFEGTEPANTVKGQWAASDSPMSVRLRRLRASTNAASARLSALGPERRKALAELPPAFSEKALAGHLAFLADPARGGRMPGTEGHDETARYIADQFQRLGLAPAADAGGYFQAFELPASPERAAAGGTRATASNVIGHIPGTRPEWKGQAVIVAAHYDHLGTGWPDVHKGDEGKVHPGADDNASGVAVMLELARVLAAAEPPPRSIVFIAFSGEEAGRLGSRHYVDHARLFPPPQTIGVINLDTVGRLGTRPISVFGTGTASEWQHIFRGAGFVTGVESTNVPDSPESSDQVSFTAKGVPAVQVFAGAHADYHRPTDTTDKIDLGGLVKVAAFTREAVAYLAERPEPLSAATAASAPAGGEGRPAGERRASVGTVPDFAFAGPGVRVSSVVAGSPAERAGVKAGDVLTAVDGKPVADLRAYSDLLRALAPGRTVRVVVVRDGKEQALEVTLAER